MTQYSIGGGSRSCFLVVFLAYPYLGIHHLGGILETPLSQMLGGHSMQKARKTAWQPLLPEFNLAPNHHFTFWGVALLSL